MPENQLPKENLTPKEPFTTVNQRVSLQARLMIGGDALSPAKLDIPKINSENLTTISEQTIIVINSASTKERSEYWTGKESYQIQMETWLTSFQKYSGLSQEQSLLFYNRYFYSPNKESNIQRFVDDNLEPFNTHGGIDLELLNQHLPDIKRLANVFGANSSEIVEAMILVKAKISSPEKKQELINQLNEEKPNDSTSLTRLNWLNPDEKRLLSWLNQPFTPDKKELEILIEESPNVKEPIITEQKKESELPNPWSDVPKPKRPEIIQKGLVTRNKDNQITGEQAETTLFIGTLEYPLVAEHKWSNGKVEKVRRINPERPYHIPIIIYLDDDISHDQQALITQTLNKVLDEIGVPKDKLVKSVLPGAKYISRSQKRANIQVNSDQILHFAQQDTKQLNEPHLAVILTNKDLYSQETNFVIGSARSDLGTVISLKRAVEGIDDPTLRDQVIQTEIAHEVGHVFNLPSGRRGEHNINQSLGPHCKNPGCCMKQGLNFPADFITITKDRLTNLGDKFYCVDCHLDLQQKFKK